jgi:hypothetical protein
VRAAERGAVLVIAETSQLERLSDQIRVAGHNVLATATANEALVALSASALILAVLVVLAATGSDFVLALRRRRPALPIIVLASSAHELAALHAAPEEAPVLVGQMPPSPAQMQELLRFVL